MILSKDDPHYWNLREEADGLGISMAAMLRWILSERYTKKQSEFSYGNKTIQI